jgi:hypothetical protein
VELGEYAGVDQPKESAVVRRADRHRVPVGAGAAHDYDGALRMAGTDHQTVARLRAHRVQHFDVNVVDVRFHSGSVRGGER